MQAPSRDRRREPDERQRLPGHRGDRDQHHLVEEAAKNAVETAAKTLRDLRVGEVVRFDVTMSDGKVTNYRARVNISFKYESS